MMKLPESLYFLRKGWWAVHIISVAAVFAAGFAVSTHHAGHASHGEDARGHVGHSAHGAHGGEKASHDAHAGHASHGEDATASHASHDAPGQHDHTSAQGLKPLMQQMLTESVQLQGALSVGDVARAKTHATAIKSSCDDGGGAAPHGALPARLGPAFSEHDRALHARAGSLSEALDKGDLVAARALNSALIADCQSCHAQSPAAQGVDLLALKSFADTLLAPATIKEEEKP